MNEDTQKLIGTILDQTAQRDAIHIAVVPLVAGERLWPGRQIGLAYGTTDRALIKDRCYGCNPIGIVDPFLKGAVEKGQRFFAFLFPGTVTGMRHHWCHSAFDQPPKPNSEAEEWLQRFADKWNFDYDEMISGALEKGGEGFVTARGIDLHSREELDAGDEELFWHHLEMLTGQKFSEPHRMRFTWSCYC